jgi:hypothetical protein
MFSGLEPAPELVREQRIARLGGTTLGSSAHARGSFVFVFVEPDRAADESTSAIESASASPSRMPSRIRKAPEQPMLKRDLGAREPPAIFVRVSHCQ